LIVTIGDVVHNVTLECGHCDRVTYSNVACNISIRMTSPEGSEPTTPWENYWVASSSGQTMVGGYDSTLMIYEEEIVGMNLIDSNKTISCDECSHPKPKSKGGKSGKHGRKLAKGGKKPPAFANSKLYDTQGDGE
jgi:hypothetical protein